MASSPLVHPLLFPCVDYKTGIPFVMLLKITKWLVEVDSFTAKVSTVEILPAAYALWNAYSHGLDGVIKVLIELRILFKVLSENNMPMVSGVLLSIWGDLLGLWQV